MAPVIQVPMDKLKSEGYSSTYNKTEHPIFHKTNILFLTLDKLESKRMVANLNNVAKVVIDAMRLQDSLFATMYKRCQYTGSFYEGTRVGAPTKFDLNLVMKIPINYGDIKVIDDSCTVNGSAKIVMPKTIKDDKQVLLQKGFQRVINWCDQSNCLDQNQFRNWVKGVVTKALNNMVLENGVCLITIQNKLYKIALSESGPAITLNVVVGEDKMDIDLVPALVFSYPNWPGKDFRLEPFKKVQGDDWFAIPKPVKTHASDAVKCRSWRIVFPQQDKRLLYHRYCLKNIMRIVKKLRDTQGLTIIASYYIKTVFLLENEEKDVDFWRHPMGYVFMIMLKRLHFYVKRKNLPNYWYRSQNLFETLDETALSQVAARLENIIKTIENKFKEDNFIMCRFILNHDEQTELWAAMHSDDRLTHALRNLKI